MFSAYGTQKPVHCAQISVYCTQKFFAYFLQNVEFSCGTQNQYSCTFQPKSDCLLLGKGPKKKLGNFGHMSKWGLPSLPSTQIWTKIHWANAVLNTVPTFTISLDILLSKFALEHKFSYFC